MARGMRVANERGIKLTPATRLVERAQGHLRTRRRGATRSQRRELDACIRALESARALLAARCGKKHSIF